MKTSTLAGLAVASLLATSFAITTESSASDRIRYQCSAFGSTDISMTARYEIRSARRKFTTEFEAGPRTGFNAGSRVNIQVKGVVVGSALLESITGGTVADLNFDTQPQLDASPFPGNWPANVGRGTVVNVLKGTTKVLGCTLR